MEFANEELPLRPTEDWTEEGRLISEVYRATTDPKINVGTSERKCAEAEMRQTSVRCIYS